MSKNTRSNVKHSSKNSPGSEEKIISTPSTPEIKKKPKYSNDDGETSEREKSDNGKSIDKSDEDIHFGDKELRQRKAPDSREEQNNDSCDGNRFPCRRPSYHNLGCEELTFQRTTKGSVSKHEDVSPLLITKKNEGTLETTNLFVCKTNKWGANSIQWYIIYILCILVLYYVAQPMIVGIWETNTLTIDSIKQKFPKQQGLLWKAITSGLYDTLTFEHPSSYLLIHEIEAADTAKKLIKELSHYAVCHLSNCNNVPIKLNNKVLDSSELVNNSDYGVIISRFKEDLGNIGVMVVENLDEIPEKYALAFHSFCDQVSPLVKKSAFFFTIKIDKLEGSTKHDIRKVEKILREKWKYMEDDIFSPLFTRLTDMLIRIQPE